MFDSPRIFHQDLTHFGVIMEQNNYRLNFKIMIWTVGEGTEPGRTWEGPERKSLIVEFAGTGH